MLFGMMVQAEDVGTEERIKKGVFARNIDLSEKTVSEAEQLIRSYVKKLESISIFVEVAGGKVEDVKISELGMKWSNTDLAEEAVMLGNRGNVIRRYKEIKDLEHEDYVFDIELDFDKELMRKFLEEECTKHNQDVIDISLQREKENFRIVQGQMGYVLNVEESVSILYEFLTKDWNHKSSEISMIIDLVEPRGQAEELSRVQDLLATYSTSYRTSSAERCANIENGVKKINGVTLYPGDEFSFCDQVTPFSFANGYYKAGSYLNGKVVDSVGGGICQVSTTLYNAVLRAELEVIERHNHSMIVSYVEPSADAAVSESAGKDFKFVNNLDYPIYIEAFARNKVVTFNIYGKEMRPDNREVRFCNQIIELINPAPDVIHIDGTQPVGYIVIENSHIGYKAQLWKIELKNGSVESRTQVNSSRYKMTPRVATVGVATNDLKTQEEIMAAIGTGNIDHVNHIISTLVPQASAVAVVPEV